MLIENYPFSTSAPLLGEQIDTLIFAEFKSHVLIAIEHAKPGNDPFRHLYVENILPEVLYNGLREKMLKHKYQSTLLDRTQDSTEFTNKRFSLAQNQDIEVQYFYAIFSDNEVKAACLRKFFLDITPNLVESVQIHNTEFEYMYTEAGKFQNIHVDIPPKFLSFVFYFPEFEVCPEAELKNATVLYDTALEPCYVARYRPNSVCIFAPHFYSYHGFSTTIDREVLVMFYINPELMNLWAAARGAAETPPFEPIRTIIDEKLKTYQLIEYGRDPVIRDIARRTCLINAPRGRVIKDNNS